MLPRFLTLLAPFAIVSVLGTQVLLAQAAQVKIIGPDAAYTYHDITTIALDLGEMLKTASDYSGSSASATILAGRSLMESYYHPEQKGATRGVLDTKYNYLVILPETGFLEDVPEAAFDGVLQMSRRALNAGSTPLLLMPRGGTVPIATLGENAYRIGNGSGIATVPGGYAVDSAGLSAPSTNTRNLRRQAYVLAATLFSQITGLNAASNTTYVPKDSAGVDIDVVNLAGKAAATITTHASTNHYTTSRHLSGIVSYRTIAPPNNRVRYAFTGTSTENGISDRLDEIIQSSGHTAAPHIRPTSDGLTWTQTVFDKVKTTFAAAPNEYLFLYGRNTSIAAQPMIDYNQANLIPIYIDRHNDGVQTGDLSTRILLRDLHQRTSDIYYYQAVYGWKGAPIHLGHARLNDVDPSIYYSGDGTHMTSENYYMVASTIFTSMLGKNPIPPSTLTAKQLKGFNVGNQMAKELAFLSETMAFTPESSLLIEPTNTLETPRWVAFSHSFTATGGTPPYTWTEASASSLPAGVNLSSGGVLSGTVSSLPQTWQLVIKVTDSAGAICKFPVAHHVTTGPGSLSVSTPIFSPIIPLGGPVPSATTTYALQNPGLTIINWTANPNVSWLALSPGSGTLAAGQSVNVAASVNSGAASLAVGTHPATIEFTNTTSGFGNTSRSINLRVNAPPVVNAGTDRSILYSPVTPWTPVALNPVGWYDATDATTITQTGGSVSQWRSKNGVNPMLQSTATAQPTTGTALINGLNAIAFDGSNDFLRTATNPFGSQGDQIPNAMIMLVTNIGTLADDTMFTLSGISDASKRWEAQAASASGSLIFDCGGTGGSSRVSGASGWTAGQSKLLGFSNFSTSNVQQIWESGTLKLGDATGHKPTVWTGMTLAYDGKTASTYDNCTMGEVVIINRVVGNENRQRLEGYLSHKWGFAATLPAAHPYKPAPLSGTLINLSGTASDPDNDPLNPTWSVVSGPSGFLFDDTNTMNPTLFFTVPGSYTLRLTVSDGSSQKSDDVVINVTNLTPYQIWSGGPFTNPFTLTGAMDDPDGDDRENLLEFAFGTDPTVPTSAPLSYVSGGDITSPGGPILAAVENQPGVFNAIFIRRKNHATAGIAYSVLFSADLQEWTASAAGLSVVTDPSSAGDMEAASVPFPSSVPLGAGGNAPPTFFRLSVGSN